LFEKKAKLRQYKILGGPGVLGVALYYLLC